MPRELTLMADYGASPLWENDELGRPVISVPLDRFSLGGDLERELMDWSHQFETAMARDDGFLDARRARLDKRGKTLATRVATELGPGFQVAYRPGA
ncbi:MAG: hypothetical protein JWO76_1477 [Nocardioides sp.]|nr:hypothetical protein [Nocardioides sp.]